MFDRQSPIPSKRFTQPVVRSICAVVAALPLLGTVSIAPVRAQIVPAGDGTGTLINTTGNQFDITGGQTSSNGANLFHSFSQFDLNTGQTANFQPNSTVQNILGRVVSGNASTINGLIQVSGSQANLYLMNPSGIIFGSNASLNVPASFIATTATGIGFGDNWFNAAGNNNYAQLGGTPNAFAFTTSQPGSIINSGNLAVGTGQTLALLGGTVVNTGQLNAPAGQIRIAAVQGGSFVRVTQPGFLLSLEVPVAPSSNNTPTQWTLPVLSLPQLLTGGNVGHATGLSVNAAGQVMLTGSGIQVPTESGSAIASGNLNTSGTAPGQTGGTVHVLGNKLGLVGVNINASGTNGGGTVLIGGDYQGKGTVPNAARTFVSSDSVINVDAITQGDGGRAIIWSNEVTGFSGNISARGGTNGGNGGFVEVSGKQNLVFNGAVDVTASQGNWGTLLLDPTNITISNAPDTGGVTANLPDILQGDFAGADININAGTLQNQAGNVVLQASNNITVANGVSLNFVPGGSITFTADADTSGVGSFLMDATQSITASGRNLTISGASITVGTITTNNPLTGGAINLNATGNITAGRLDSGTNAAGIGGPIAVNSTAGAITITQAVEAGSAGQGLGSGGNIVLTARDNITTADVISRSNSVGTAGTITITSNEGSIDTTAATFGVHAFGASGGTVTLNARGDIRTGSVRTNTTAGSTGNAGNITLNSTTGNINNTIELNSSSVAGNGGAIALTATNGDVRVGNINSLALNQGGTGGAVILNAGNTINASQINTTTSPLANYGNITLTSNGINLRGGANSIRGDNATLVIQTNSPSQGITIAGTTDSGTNAVDLQTTDLAAIAPGFTSITIGRSDGTGTITLNPFNFNAPVNIAGGSTLVGPNQNTTWTLTGANGGSISGFPNGLTFSSIENLRGGTANDTFIFANGGTGANLTIDAGLGNDTITVNEPLTVTGNLSLSTGLDGGDITVNNAINAGSLNLNGTNITTASNGTLTTNGAGGINVTANNLSLNAPILATGGGVVTVIADNNITTRDITANGGISLTSNNGSIDTRSGTLNSSSNTGNGGAIALSAPGNITTNNINSYVATIIADNNITTRDITANGGISLTSNNGSIDTRSGTLNSSSNTGNSGAIALSAAGNITTNNITSHSDTNAGGDITLNSQTGVVNTGNLDASGNTRGGNITVIAREQITTREINSSALTGDGGNVTLDPIGDIQVDFINAQGGTSGKGGKVDITTNQFFRALRSFSDRNGINASISTAGGTGGGDIIIRHDGGARQIPFAVGNATTNGTVGAITTGLSNSILPLRSFPGSYTQRNIQIITQNPPPLPISFPLPIPDSDSLSEDSHRENLVSQGIDRINATARALLDTTAILRNEINQAIARGQLEKAIAQIEQLRIQEFQNYFEGNLPTETTESVSLEQTQAILNNIAENTGKTPAVIYVFTQPEQLQLILVTSKGKPILKTVHQANKTTLLKIAAKFRSDVTEVRKKTAYKETAKQLYEWLIAPLEAEFQAHKIDTLVFSMDTGLRSIPLAALYDGQQFLIEKYSIGLIPSINLTDTRYRDVKTAEVLAMGASKFAEQNALPAVPVELSRIVGKPNLEAQERELLPANQSFSQGLWTGKSFLNQGFTLANLKAQRTQTPYGVIHLATHGEFNRGAPRNSYIQLWDTKLQLDQLRQMGWNNPPVELLVLSACRTALGNEDAEFGFAGLAVAAGVKSAIASLWYVSDEGTLGLVTEFYQQLKTAPIKAEALRQAQIAMIKGQVRMEGGQLRDIVQEGSIPLPPELANAGDKEFSHPYYWSAFTIIGSPW